MTCPHCRSDHPPSAESCPQTGQPIPGALAAGTLLADKYRVLRRLATGGMGSVYEVEHTLIGKHVALKLLHPEFAQNPDIVARFRREARAASAIGHENIIDIQDIGQTEDGGFFIVMELLRGVDLADLAAGEPDRKLDPVRAGRLMLQVLAGLGAAHQNGIVHRDLKPANVFVTRRKNGEEFVKLLDFGISKMVSDEPSMKLTSTGFVLGTPYYMAPEQAMGAAAVDHRADIYSAGSILYELVTGKSAVDEPNFNAVLFAIATGKIKKPREVAPELEPEYERIILRAMTLDRNERYQSSEELAADLESCLRAMLGLGPDVPVLSPFVVGGAVTPAPGTITAPPGLAMAVPASGRSALTPSTGVAAQGGAVAAPASATGDATGDEPAHGKRSRAGLLLGAVLAIAALAGGGALWVLHARSPGDAPSAPPSQAQPMASHAPAPPVVTVPVTSPRSAAPIASAAPVPAEQPSLVAIVVRATPPDAKLELDGKPVAEGSTQRLPRDGATHVLKGQRSGYLPGSLTFMADAAKPVLLELKTTPRGGAQSHRHHPTGPGGSIDL